MGENTKETRRWTGLDGGSTSRNILLGGAKKLEECGGEKKFVPSRGARSAVPITGSFHKMKAPRGRTGLMGNAQVVSSIINGLASPLPYLTTGEKEKKNMASSTPPR